MLDYELLSKPQDIDVELRYSYQHLQSFGSAPPTAAAGQAEAENPGLYLALPRPRGTGPAGQTLRYVLEGARTEYLGGSGPARLQQHQLPGSWRSNSTAASTTSLSPVPGWVARCMFSHSTSGLLHRAGDGFPARHGDMTCPHHQISD